MTPRLVSCCLAALLVAPAPAAAYVCSTTVKSAKCLRWMNTSCVYLHVNSSGSPDVTDGSAVTAVHSSAANWRAAVASCSFINMLFVADSPDAVAAFDQHGTNENTVDWVSDKWSTPTSQGGREHDAQAAAITTVFFIDAPGDARDGQILDADIELNNENFRFATTGAKDRTDVENTVTHEMGHLLGIDHPCDDGTRVPAPKDNTGATIPSCFPVYKLPQTMRDATMFNFADPGETKKRTPEADDVLGICTTYPKAMDPGVCAPASVRDQGCSLGSAGAPPLGLPALLGALLLGLIALRRR
jgi:hypothetical protein